MKMQVDNFWIIEAQRVIKNVVYDMIPNAVKICQNKTKINPQIMMIGTSGKTMKFAKIQDRFIPQIKYKTIGNTPKVAQIVGITK